VKYQTKMGLNMTLKKIIAVLTVIAATAFGGLIYSAHAVTYVYDSLNRLTEVHFDDSTWIQYTYDDIGNQTGKTYYNQFFPVTVISGSGGTISPSSANVIYGGSQTFIISPNTGYYADVQVDGVDQGAITSYTFSNVTAAHTISATFAIDTFNITVSAGANGSISPTNATVNYGGSQSFTISPNTGYYPDVLVDGVDQGAITSYTFSNVTAAHTISATFAPGYTITTSAGANGSISPSGPVGVNPGANQTFTISPNTGYYADVVVDGVDQGAITSYTFSNVTATHTISATFAPGFTITTSAGANGSISPSGPVGVNPGANQTFTISPNTGYYADVVVDGVDQGAITSYTFSNVTATHTISATFAITTYTVTPSAGTGGSISPSTPQAVNYDGTTSFTVTPNTGYSIGSVTGCGGTLSGSTYTTGLITGNCTVSAAFAINSYTVTPSAGTGGSISPSTPQAVNYDGTTSFTVTPNTGYSIGSVTGCGGSLSGNTYTTGQITGNCTVSAAFAINSYTVTPSAGTGGSISPSTPQAVNYDGTTSFTVTPNTGYSIGSVTGCGGSLSGSTYTTGLITGNCSVSAVFAINTYTVTPSAGTGGSISPSTAQTVNYDGTTSFTVTPNTGYSIGSVAGCGGTLSGNTYTTGQVTGNCSVSAAFAINSYTVTPSAGTGGSISPSTPQAVNYDGTTSFTVTPNTGYSIGSVTGCGGSLSGSTYTTGLITGNCTVSAAFAINSYTVTPSAGTGGSISPSTPQAVNYDGTTSFTVTPNTGYSISSVTGCGGTLSGSTYTTGLITGNCTVSAAFSPNTYSITASVGADYNGTISSPGVTNVNYGGSVTYTITPFAGGYASISNVLVDGVSVGAVSSYTFNNVQGNHTIVAEFAVAAGAAGWGANGTYYWTAPFTGTIVVQAWGGGGGGGGSSSSQGGGGGGGAYYWSGNWSVTEGVQYQVIVGAGGTQGAASGAGGTGGTSYFNGTGLSSGGTGGKANGTAGTGGNKGGAGKIYFDYSGGTGGAGGAGQDGGAGGAGGTGNTSSTAVGKVGSGPGGGGGGGGSQGATFHGGAGADGEVYISWGAQ
jgi:hypothetical protein